MKQKLKIYPSSSGYQIGKLYQVDYNSSCHRYQLVSQGIFKDLDPKYAQIGTIHEEWFNNTRQDIMEREVVIKKEYAGNVEYSGRLDFRHKDGSISETKASLSKSVLYSTIRKKEVKLSHLAQLTSYLVHTETDRGSIVVGYYKELTDISPKEYAIFDVAIDEQGQILVDNKPYKYNVHDYLTYLFTLIHHLEFGTIGDRPMAPSPWQNPCSKCPLLELCDKYDLNLTDNKTEKDDQFKKEAINILTENKNELNSKI